MSGVEKYMKRIDEIYSILDTQLTDTEMELVNELVELSRELTLEEGM